MAEPSWPHVTASASPDATSRAISAARHAWLGLDEDDPDEADASTAGLTLHAAMELVLREWGPTRITKLAEEIEKRGLYRRRDGKAPGPHQIHARVHNYPGRFVRVSPGVVGLRGGTELDERSAESLSL